MNARARIIGPVILLAAALFFSISPPSNVMSQTPATPTPFPAGAANSAWTPVQQTINTIPAVYVPAGCFEMGSATGYYDEERPVHTVCLSAFWIGQTEVTNGQYAACVRADACPPPYHEPIWFDAPAFHYADAAYAEYPVVFVSWNDAVQFAAWAGGRLPTEAEWEYAARGPESLPYTWGDTFDGRLVNACDTRCPFTYHETDLVDDGFRVTAPGDAFPGGASWVGALNMAGNVWERTADWYWPDAYALLSDGVLDPITGPEPHSRRYSAEHVVRGASWGDPTVWSYAAHREHMGDFSCNFVTGFRVVFDVQRD